MLSSQKESFHLPQNDYVPETKHTIFSNSQNKALDVLIVPNLLQFLDFQILLQYKYIAKVVYESMKDNHLGLEYWKALCSSFAVFYGLYMDISHKTLNIIGYRKYFIQDLWELRYKWPYHSNKVTTIPTKAQDFKIKVSCRFRPGERGNKNVFLPLHQYIKVKRQQKYSSHQQLNSTNTETSFNSMVIGEEDPEEYLDPFLGTLMRDPVLLTSSNRIVDRSVALQAIRQGGRDPFNGKRLIQSMLQPQLELQNAILAWKLRKESRDFTLSLMDIKELIEESAIHPELLQALIDVQKLAQDAHRAELEIESQSQLKRKNRWNNNTPTSVAVMEDMEEVPVTMWQEVGIEHIPTEMNMIGMNAVIENEFIELANPHFSPHVSNKKEAEKARVVDISEEKASVSMNVPGSGIRSFQFMSVHDGSTPQEDIYNECAKEMIYTTLNGFNACILCYGQTGSGKTHTFFGPDETLYEELLPHDECIASCGIVVRTCVEMIRAKNTLVSRGIHIGISAQFIEIYDEQIIDLLAMNDSESLEIRRESGEIIGAREVAINDIQSMFATLRLGHSRKRFAATAMNDRSSRSHTALIIQVSQTNDQFPDYLIKSKLHLVDLAGSERVKKSRSEGVRLREAVGINYSLLVLGKVIAHLVNGNSHVPYYESKLTTMLKAAFGGNSRTCAIVNCKAEDLYGDETLQSLRFGERCSMISNTIKAAASSFASAIASINQTMLTIENQIKGLEDRGKNHLESYRRLVESLDHMKKKRDLLLVSS